jgi:hypothetical protein
MVALAYFALRSQPVLSFTSRNGSALLIEFVSATPDLVFQINRKKVFPGFSLDHFELPAFRGGFRF